VPTRNRHASRAQEVDELERTWKLGRERHVRDRPRGEEALEKRDVGIATIAGRMRAEALGR
jgi:hypothetical protein